MAISTQNVKSALLAVALACWWGVQTTASCSAEATASADAAASVENPYPLATEGPRPEPITPPTSEEVHQSITRGVEFLLNSQLKSGAWGSAENSKYYMIWAPVPGAHQAYRMGTTGLVIEALLDVRKLYTGEMHERIEKSLDRSQDWLLENGPLLRRAAPDMYDDYFGNALYNVWGHAYAIQAAIGLYHRAEGNSELQQKLRKVVEFQVQRLSQDEFLDGGWGYYDDVLTDRTGQPAYPRRARTERPTGSSISFTTATILLALKQAEEFGVEVPEKLTKRAVDSIVRQRYPDFAFAYGEYLKYVPREPINRPAGSLGRSQVCNLALRKYGDKLVTDEVLKTWLNRLIARNGWLSMSRKRNYPAQSPHYADFNIAGYFYYYAHYYAIRCVEELPPAERPYYQDQLAHVLLSHQETDGSWWDYIMYDYHQQYGTAMAVSTLSRCLHDSAGP